MSGGGGLRRVAHAADHAGLLGGAAAPSPPLPPPRNKWGPQPLAPPLGGGNGGGSGGGGGGGAPPPLGIDDLAHPPLALPPPPRRGAERTAELAAAAASYEAAVAARRGDFLRVLSSRLAEVRELASLWRSAGGAADGHLGAASAGAGAGVGEAADASVLALALAPERVYVAALRHLRNSCHEWAAVDVLSELAHCDSGAAVGGEADSPDEGGALWLRGGLPVWAFPRATSLRWARYLCPVLQSLLFSAYEDYIEVAVGACERTLDALAPLFEAASDPLRASVADLAVPPPAAAAAAPALAGEGEDGEKGGGSDEGAARLQRRLFAHAAATGAVQAVRLTQPLAAALGVAASTVRAGGGNGETQRAAVRVQRRLLRMHDSVAHLVRAA